MDLKIKKCIKNYPAFNAAVSCETDKKTTKKCFHQKSVYALKLGLLEVYKHDINNKNIPEKEIYGIAHSFADCFLEILDFTDF